MSWRKKKKEEAHILGRLVLGLDKHLYSLSHSARLTVPRRPRGLMTIFSVIPNLLRVCVLACMWRHHLVLLGSRSTCNFPVGLSLWSGRRDQHPHGFNRAFKTPKLAMNNSVRALMKSPTGVATLVLQHKALTSTSFISSVLDGLLLHFFLAISHLLRFPSLSVSEPWTQARPPALICLSFHFFRTWRQPGLLLATNYQSREGDQASSSPEDNCSRDVLPGGRVATAAGASSLK